MTTTQEVFEQVLSASRHNGDLYETIMEKVSEYARACEDRVRYLETGRYVESGASGERALAIHREICALVMHSTMGPATVKP